MSFAASDFMKYLLVFGIHANGVARSTAVNVKQLLLKICWHCSNQIKKVSFFWSQDSIKGWADEISESRYRSQVPNVKVLPSWRN